MISKAFSSLLRVFTCWSNLSPVSLCTVNVFPLFCQLISNIMNINEGDLIMLLLYCNPIFTVYLLVLYGTTFPLDFVVDYLWFIQQKLMFCNVVIQTIFCHMSMSTELPGLYWFRSPTIEDEIVSTYWCRALIKDTGLQGACTAQQTTPKWTMLQSWATQTGP